MDTASFKKVFLTEVWPIHVSFAGEYLKSKEHHWNKICLWNMNAPSGKSEMANLIYSKGRKV